MGNWSGKILSKEVHPLDDDGQRRTTTITTRSSSSVRIKARMTVKQLKDLAAQVDMSKDTNNSELGRLILQQCLEGKLSASSPVVVAGRRSQLSKTPRDRSILSTIHED
ncbi:hypothetical protein L484_023418 [Morus notabilis]|uniref:Uncharacterized protein n=1 Tax=Morus notabilis TaxID=981085 RepID=W9RNT7_9ROSA|nr:hypothetical protein L484_023418 [Morus notabilis]